MRPIALPLPFAAGVLVGAGIERLVPLGLPLNSRARALGYFWLSVVGLVLGVASLVNISLAKGRLVTAGPYRFSRNPVYVAFFFLQLSFGAEFGNAWIILLSPVTLLVSHFWTVLPESVNSPPASVRSMTATASPFVATCKASPSTDEASVSRRVSKNLAAS